MNPSESFFYSEITSETLGSEIERLRLNLSSRPEYSTDTILAVLDTFAVSLDSDEFREIEGIAFLSGWLREQNVRRLLAVQFGELLPALDAFVSVDNVQLRAARRGIAAHWIAGNVPTLTFFSFALSLLAKNANLIRISKSSVRACELLFRKFAATTVKKNGVQITGTDLLGTTSVFHFPSDQRELNETMSLAADVRILWGGPEAVQSITRLPRLEHAEDVVFGPKFSIVVVDANILENEAACTETARNIVRDIILFDQTACSSPQIIFVEGNLLQARSFASRIQSQMERVSSRSPLQSLSESTAAGILTTRAEYALSSDRDLLCPPTLDYSVFVDSGVFLSEALQSRSVFVRSVSGLMDILPLLSPKIQTIGAAIGDSALKTRFCEQAAARGISRIVPPGTMNAFDVPWDGMRVLDRLVRWVSLRV